MKDLPLTLEALENALRTGDKTLRQKLMGMAGKVVQLPWHPQEGPQMLAYFTKADETLYGGAAGGGKTDLLLGLATTQHQRSLIFRAQSKDMDGLWERLAELIPNPAQSDSVKRRMKTADGRIIEGGHLDRPGSEKDWQGRPHDFIGFDEAAQLDEMRVSFVLQWIRSTDPKQRKRAVFATNPPIPEIKNGIMTDVSTGDWLLRWFAPWVDDTFPNPAAPGELRWCFMRAEGDRLVTVWVEGPGWYDPESAGLVEDPSEEDKEKGRVSAAKSRTFIRSLLKDNVFLKGTGYAEKLSGTPEPLKSMLLNGDFTIKGADHPMQVIPTEWVLAAQERWRERDWDNDVKRLRQLVLYGDIAQGGVDTTVLAPLYETDYYDELITQPGSKTPNGNAVVAMVLEERLDQSLIALDATGGWAGSTRDLLMTLHGIDVEMHVVSKTDGSWTPDMVYRYLNLRSKMWWEFRLALDPKSGFSICLPPSARLRAQLTAPHWTVKGRDLIIESKDALRQRLNSSTDEADAVIGAWQYREQALAKRPDPVDDFIDRLNGRTAAGPDDYDPREGW